MVSLGGICMGLCCFRADNPSSSWKWDMHPQVCACKVREKSCDSNELVKGGDYLTVLSIRGSYSIYDSVYGIYKNPCSKRWRPKVINHMVEYGIHSLQRTNPNNSRKPCATHAALFPRKKTLSTQVPKQTGDFSCFNSFCILLIVLLKH